MIVKLSLPSSWVGSKRKTKVSYRVIQNSFISNRILIKCCPIQIGFRRASLLSMKLIFFSLTHSLSLLLYLYINTLKYKLIYKLWFQHNAFGDVSPIACVSFCFVWSRFSIDVLLYLYLYLYLFFIVNIRLFIFLKLISLSYPRRLYSPRFETLSLSLFIYNYLWPAGISPFFYTKYKHIYLSIFKNTHFKYIFFLSTLSNLSFYLFMTVLF